MNWLGVTLMIVLIVLGAAGIFLSFLYNQPAWLILTVLVVCFIFAGGG